MEMKKILPVLVSCTLAASMMTGCGGAANNNAAPANASTPEKTQETKSTEKSEGVVEVTYWDQHADPVRTEIFKKIIADFEAENPKIKVNYVPLPGDQAKAKYDVAIQSNTAPDCGGVSQYWMSDFIIQDALVALDDYIAAWENKGDMVEMFHQSIKNMSSDGKTYGLAHTVTLPAVWYNKNILETTGDPIPTNWDEVLKAVEKTTDKANGVYGFSIRGGGGSSQQFEQMMYQQSGIVDMFDAEGKSTANDPAHVELLEKFAAIYNVYTPESDVTNGYAEMVSAFGSSSAAMIFHNLGSYGQHKETLGEGNFGALTALTSKKGTNTLVSNGTMTLSVFKDSKNPEQAFKFISYLTEHVANSYFNEKIGQIPCNKLALQDEWIQKAAPIKETADTLLDTKTTLATLPINVIGYYDLHQNTLVEGFQSVLLGQTTAKAYLDNWAAEMTKLKADYDAYVTSK